MALARNFDLCRHITYARPHIANNYYLHSFFRLNYLWSVKRKLRPISTSYSEKLHALYCSYLWENLCAPYGTPGNPVQHQSSTIMVQSMNIDSAKFRFNEIRSNSHTLNNLILKLEKLHLPRNAIAEKRVLFHIWIPRDRRARFWSWQAQSYCYDADRMSTFLVKTNVSAYKTDFHLKPNQAVLKPCGRNAKRVSRLENGVNKITRTRVPRLSHLMNGYVRILFA